MPFTKSDLLGLREACEYADSIGWKISPARLSRGIQSGEYGFGKVINTGSTGRKTYEISAAGMQRYISGGEDDIKAIVIALAKRLGVTAADF